MDAGLIQTLIGALVGGTLTFAGAYFQLRTQIGESRRERKALEEHTNHTMIAALITEMRMNAALDQDPRTQTVWIPYRREALTAALPYLAALPRPTFLAVQQASHGLALYNEVAVYANTLAAAGTRQTAVTDKMDADERAGKAAASAQQQQLAAATALETHRASLVVHLP